MKVTDQYAARSITISPSETVASDSYSFADWQEISLDVSDNEVAEAALSLTTGSRSYWTVTALKAGTAVLTAHIINYQGNPVSAECTLTVIEPEPTPEPEPEPQPQTDNGEANENSNNAAPSSSGGGCSTFRFLTALAVIPALYRKHR